MPRTLFARLLTHSALVLLAMLLVAGLALDRFLIRRELRLLEDQLALRARLAAVDLPTHLPELQEAVRRRGAAGDFRLTVIARDGTVLADSHHDPTTMDNHANRPEISAALSGQQGSAIRPSPTLGVEMLYVALPGTPVIRAAMPQSDVAPLLQEIRRRVFLGSLPAVLLALLLAFFLSGRLTRRFAAMSELAFRLADGEYEASLPASGQDELAGLEQSLLSLRDELRKQVGALRRDRQRLAALVNGLPDAVIVLDGERRVAVVNDPAQKLLRLHREDVEGLPSAETLRDPRILEIVDTVGQGESPGQPTSPVRISWPEPKCELEVVLRNIPDASNRLGVLIVLRDVTRQVHLERVRRDFIANLSHELRTPLTAIRGAAETLLDGALSDPAVARRFLETIRRHSLRLEALLSDVSDLARIESGSAPLEWESLDAATPVRHVLELFAAEAERAGVTMEERELASPVRIVTDPGKVESILVNLVQNAVRYTPEGGTVEVSLEPVPEGVRYVIADTGIGIPPTDIGRVTERFYRVDPGRSRAQGGTGLGLSIVKHLVEGLGGTLRIESEYGKGTRVSVVVPNRVSAVDSERG